MAKVQVSAQVNLSTRWTCTKTPTLPQKIVTRMHAYMHGLLLLLPAKGP
jgi:hypothetical protein